MRASLSFGPFGQIGIVKRQLAGLCEPREGTGWHALPVIAQLYVTSVVIVGTVVFVWFFPHTLPQPALFAVLMAVACLMSAWKVNLPIPAANGSTLSVSYAASLTALLLLGPQPSVVIATAGFLTQCTYKAKTPYPRHCTIFSTAVAAITMAATGVVYHALGGVTAPLSALGLPKPLVGAIGVYFFVNTALVAAAIATSTNRSVVKVWRDDFLWSGTSFIVAGSAGAVAAVIIARGEQWTAVLFLAPIYLTYRTYDVFIGRLDDQKRHTEEVGRLHQETVAALGQARHAERALAGEKERLAVTLAEMTALEKLRRQLLEREQTARASAETANQVKDQFLAIVSHELRTPINAILGWSDMLRRGRLEERLRDRAFRAIHDSATRQAQLIEDLLDVARITSGKMRLDRTFIDLKEVVRDALQVVQPSADVKGIRIAVDARAPVGAVYGDGARLQQVALNLLANAVKFTPQAGTIHVRIRQMGAMAEMVVTDTGQGISPHFLPTVFEAFRQADESSTRVHSGLGLGLAIVRDLVALHGGTVSAFSDGEGRGATFTVQLPIAAAVEPLDMSADRDVFAASAAEQMDSLEGMSVLVVDDDDQSREVVAAQLHDRHAAVLTASSAAYAFDLLQREHVDVVLADIGMPHEDGYALIRRLRSSQAPATASIPAAALTSLARDEDRQQALEAGFQLHLAKPIDARSLVAAVARLGKMHVV